MRKSVAKKGEMAPLEGKLLADLREMILGTRAQVARAVDAGLVSLYWNVGRRIREDILKEKRAGYGEKIVSSLGTQLETEFGRRFSKRNLFRMIRFAETFPDFPIVQALTAQLGWTHFTLMLPLENPLKRDFYSELCRVEHWSTRTLEKKIQSTVFKRTAGSQQNHPQGRNKEEDTEHCDWLMKRSAVVASLVRGTTQKGV